MEYRWDLHHLRAQNRANERCTEVKDGDRCEYIVHQGHGHSAHDGSHQWLDRDWPGFDEPDTAVSLFEDAR